LKPNQAASARDATFLRAMRVPEPLADRLLFGLVQLHDAPDLLSLFVREAKLSKAGKPAVHPVVLPSAEPARLGRHACAEPDHESESGHDGCAPAHHRAARYTESRFIGAGRQNTDD